LSTQVVFICPGTHDKPPPHDCSPETVAAIENAMRATPTTVVGVGVVTTKGLGAEPTPPPDSPQDIAKLVDLIKGTTLRTFVHCRYCATDSTFTSEMLAEAQKSSIEPARVQLNPPSAGDLALIEAIKETTGAAGLKASYANAGFVLANLSLLTVLVTTLGLSKQDEIGSKLTDTARAICLAIALVAGALAIIFSLFAIRATVSDVVVENLEDVRTYLSDQVRDRAGYSTSSLLMLGVALFSVVVGFIIVLAGDVTDNNTPSGTLKVAIDPGSLNVTVDASWTNAPEGSSMTLIAATTSGGTLLSDNITSKKGAAKTSETIRVTRQASDDTLTITTALVSTTHVGQREKTTTDASKQECYKVPTTGGITKLDKCS
jgi:hypothetical protein